MADSDPVGRVAKLIDAGPPPDGRGSTWLPTLTPLRRTSTLMLLDASGINRERDGQMTLKTARPVPEPATPPCPPHPANRPPRAQAASSLYGWIIAEFSIGAVEVFLVRQRPPRSEERRVGKECKAEWR